MVTGDGIQVIPTVISICSSLFCSICVATFAWINSKGEERKKHKEELQKRQNLLLLQMVESNNLLSYACAKAIQRGKPNGEIEVGIEAYEQATKAYKDFLMELSTEV